MTDNTETTIPNWTMFGAKAVSIEVSKQMIDNHLLYNPQLSFFLHDGSDSDEQRVVTIFTDVYSDDLNSAIMQCVYHVDGLFDSISNTVFVFDGDDVEQEIKLDELFAKIQQDTSVKSPKAKTLH